MCFETKERKEFVTSVITSVSADETVLAANLLLHGNNDLVSITSDSPNLDTSAYPHYIRMRNLDAKPFLVYNFLISVFKWKNIGIVFSDNDYGEMGYLYYLDVLKPTGLCLSLVSFFSNENEETVLNSIKENIYLDAVILWLTSEDGLKFFNLAETYKLYNRTWIASPLLSEVKLDVLETFHPYLVQGMLILKDIKAQEVHQSGFMKYFWNWSNSTVKNRPWLVNFLEKNSLNMKNINTSILKNNISSKSYQNIHNLYKALHFTSFDITSIAENAESEHEMMQRLKVRTLHTNNLYQWLLNVQDIYVYLLQVDIAQHKIQASSLGGVVLLHEKIHNFLNVPSEARWSAYRKHIPPSTCFAQCKPGFSPLYTNGVCCWICLRCADGFVKPKHGNTMCEQCPKKTESNQNQTFCMKYKDVYVSFTSTTAYVIYILATLGLLFNLTTIVSFVKYRNTPIVRASNLPLSLFQLAVHALLFPQFLFFIGEITETTCTVTIVLQGWCVCLILGIIYSKTAHLIKIFKMKRRLSNSVMRRSFPYASIFGIQLVYLVVIITVIFYSPESGLKNVQIKSSLLNEVSCDNRNLMKFQMSFILILSFLCSIQAFRARHLPAVFSETKYIFYSAFITLIVLTMSTLLLFSQKDTNQSLLFKYLCVFLINMSTLVCMFGAKLWILLFRQHKNKSGVIGQSIYNHVLSKLDITMSRNHQKL